MINSNELFRTYVRTTIASAQRGLITSLEAVAGVSGYYNALEDLNGADELTQLYHGLGMQALLGTTEQRTHARAVLESPEKALSQILDSPAGFLPLT